MNRSIQNTISAFLIAMLLTGCATKPTPNEEFEVTETDQIDQFEGVKGTAITEVEYGNKTYLKIRAAGIVCDDTLIADYLRALRENLMPYVERETMPYMITPISDDRIYAASTPGGFIYISLGMLAFIESESELAAILAHEMAQTQYKPQRFRLTKLLFGFFRSCVKVASFIFLPGYGINYGLKAIDKFVLKDISAEKAVLRADVMAVDYLNKAGYRMSGYADMIERFKDYDARYFKQLEIYLRNRPITDKRVAALKELLAPYTIEQERKDREVRSYQKVRAYVGRLINELQP
ncbi:MAG: M48 family metallopeptidase [Candidatus Omnitrophica bacterium]|nr:M48 family metallopeptidase [Candidatus Omnitrophota bacterium]